MVTQGYTATLVVATLMISRSSLYYQKQVRGSRADRQYDEQIVLACGNRAGRCLAQLNSPAPSAANCKLHGHSATIRALHGH